MNPPRLSTATVAARIPYANAAPFYALWADAPFAVRNLGPRDLGREAEAGSVDLGLMATGDYLRLRDRFEMLAPMGVAARGPVLSVLLFSRRPANALGDSLISVTPETSTSIRLLKLLLNVRRGLSNVRATTCWEFFRELLRYRFTGYLASWKRAVRAEDPALSR